MGRRGKDRAFGAHRGNRGVLRPLYRRAIWTEIERIRGHESDEIILLSIFGTVLLVGGIAQRLQVSAAIGAFLVGIAVSGPVREQSHRLLAPLRDFFAAIFFFGLQINPASSPRRQRFGGARRILPS